MRDLEATELEFVYGAGSGAGCSPRPPASCSTGSKGSRGKSSRKNKGSSKHKGSRGYC